MSAENNMPERAEHSQPVAQPMTESMAEQMDDQMAARAEHIVSPIAYVVVFITLLCLTLVTYEVALINLGPWNVVVALTIAFIKSTLVALIFMHVYQSSRRTKLVVVAGLLWLFFLIFLTMSDYLTRRWLY
jgi:cytochrome c oxidase subunit 4